MRMKNGSNRKRRTDIWSEAVQLGMLICTYCWVGQLINLGLLVCVDLYSCSHILIKWKYAQ